MVITARSHAAPTTAAPTTAAPLSNIAGLASLIASSLLTAGIFGLGLKEHLRMFSMPHFHGQMGYSSAGGKPKYRTSSGYQDSTGGGYQYDSGSAKYRYGSGGDGYGYEERGKVRDTGGRGGYRDKYRDEYFDSSENVRYTGYSDRGKTRGKSSNSRLRSRGSYSNRDYDYDYGQSIYRGKRSVSENASSDIEDTYHNRVVQNMEMLTSLTSSDSDKCTARLVCELAAQEVERQQDERGALILRFIRHGDKLPQSVMSSEPTPAYLQMLTEFNDAALFGGKGGDCSDRFSLCSSSAEVIMAEVSSNKPIRKRLPWSLKTGQSGHISHGVKHSTMMVIAS